MAALSPDSTILLTGAAGFIGSHTAEALLKRGHTVIGVDNLDPFYDPARKEANLASIAETAEASPGRFVRVDADIADAKAVTDAFRISRPDAVVHLAARAGVRPSIANPAAYAVTNVVGTQILFDAAREARCDRFVMASSSSVYGNNKKTPFAEDDDVSFPISPYAATKRACELIAHSHRHLTGMPTACLRFFTVFGPRQRPDLAISLFLRKIAAGEPIRVFGDGSTSRDYTFIADIVQGVLSALDRITDHGYRIWNLGHSEPVSLSEMIATIERVVGREAVINREPMQPGDVDHTYADVTRSGAELGYKPATSFEDGVSAQWDWIRDHAPV